MHINIKNERVKRQFFRHLKEAEGFSDSTVNSIEQAILKYETFTKGQDLRLFNADRAVDFKKWLIGNNPTKPKIAPATYFNHLRHLRKFFLWLSGQPNFKRNINPNDIAYLKLSKKDERVASHTHSRNFPSLEYVLNLTSSIKINTEVDQRDRALIAFTALTGMRDNAISTLPMGCFDTETLTINQDPRQGVETKFSKTIQTILFKFDDNLLEYVLEWTCHLKRKGFGSADPLFPNSKTNKGEDDLAFETAKEVEPVFWKSAGQIRKIFKQRAQEAGLPPFPPHSFRHLAVTLALKSCRTGEQIKAVSQNFGHEHVATTLQSYGNYTPDALTQIINNINFSVKNTDNSKNKALQDIKNALAELDNTL